MASNKDSKTSKTAHVMNLLSKNRNAEPAPAPAAEPAAPAAAAPEAPAPAPAAAPVAPIIASINADAAVSSQIKDALEASLNPAEPAVQTPPPAPEPVRAAPAASQPAPAPQTAAPAEPAAEPAAPAEIAKPRHDTYEPPAYVNVMEVLVNEKAEKYMRASGVCCCDQCLVDVKAYALNHLPPKYVVMSRGEMIPKLTFYESQHSSDITTQLMRACDIVSKAPHHGRG